MITRTQAIITLTLTLTAACAGDDGGGGGVDAGFDASTAVTYTHDVDIQPIWTAHCIACHSGFVDAYNSMVGQITGELPSMNLIEPGDPQRSYVWLKLNDAHIEQGGEGNRMPPPPLSMLSPDDLAKIETWILEGAPR